MQKIAILYDASQVVLSTFDLDELFNQILSIARDYFHLENCAILLLDRDSQTLKVRSSFGPARLSAGIPMGRGLIGTAAKSKRPIYAADVTKDPRYINTFTSTRSELAIPLMVRDEVEGVLDFQSDKENFFDGETIDLLTLFSTQASIALANARLYASEQRRRSQLEAINGIAKQVGEVLDLEDLLSRVCAQVLHKYAVDHVSIMLRDRKDDSRMVQRAHAGKLTALMEDNFVLEQGSGVCWQALQSGQTIVVDDVNQSPYFIRSFKETESEICIPLVAFDEPYGVMVLESTRPSAFSLDDVEALQSVADICAVGIHNAVRYDAAKQMAHTDGLTGVYNRRGFETRVLEEMAQADRNRAGLGLMIVDIDHFKKLNDEFGHLLGDEVLRQVAQIFSQHLRKNDVVCRYGGEEFAILLPETKLDVGAGVAEKIRRIVSEFSFPGVPRPVTISLGLASYPSHGSNRDELVRAADAALYEAKVKGRNRVREAKVPAPAEKLI